MVEVGSLYVAFSSLGWSPRQVDGLELWEAAMLLQAPAVLRSESVTVNRDPRLLKANESAGEAVVSDAVAQRIAAAKAGLPGPTFDVP